MSDGRSGAEVFAEHRELLFAVAYRMLGTAADAEDAVQDAWLRWDAADRSQVTDPKGYLVRIVTNVSLDRLRSARARRETYVGPWLPEPVLTSPDIAEDAELAESVSMAMLVVLETLSPLERAVFVLREVFGYPYAEIAQALDRSEASVRQLGTRARKHVQARRPRFPADRSVRQRAVERFLAAALGGDVNALMETLAPDVAVWSDGGGKVRAARRVIVGADKFVRLLDGLRRAETAVGVTVLELELERADINGTPGLVFRYGTQPVVALTVDVNEQGRVTEIHLVLNPDKLHALDKGVRLEY
ncbi:RNA polymerase sigma-70 factor [Thermomonospora catenispora]|uniref:RNA polymerase sigma-70 factor n=1 Tax=Thermomonospora catenispora TaxID=2493090 RepID=UPI0019D68113|nr:RNA polymerase sigma-70 factor [Thermomonospora catenispora]